MITEFLAKTEERQFKAFVSQSVGSSGQAKTVYEPQSCNTQSWLPVVQALNQTLVSIERKRQSLF